MSAFQTITHLPVSETIIQCAAKSSPLSFKTIFKATTARNFGVKFHALIIRVCSFAHKKPSSVWLSFAVVKYFCEITQWFFTYLCTVQTNAYWKNEQENPAVARKPRDAAAVLFSLKFADDIHYKFKSSQVSKARLYNSKHTGTKQNLTQNRDSRSFKVTCFGVSGKAIRH